MGRWMAVAAAVLGCAPTAVALDYSWGEFALTVNNRLSAGAAWRLEDRDPDLLGKLNVDGQQDLCTADDCISLSGDPAPNQRLVDARGGFFSHAADDGNLNYARHDLVAATSKLTSDLTLSWRNYVFKARGYGFYDTVNSNFDEFHSNTRFQPAETRRPDNIERQIGSEAYLLDAYVLGSFAFGERNLSVSVGEQILRWGESNFIALNSISEINPPNANRLVFPGAQINEVFEPVPLVLLSFDLVANVGMELFYQLEWEPVTAPAAGSFWSEVEVAGGRDYAIIGLGQFAEDPQGQFQFAGSAGLITGTSLTARVLDDDTGRPRDSGQYGVKLNWFAENINGGTEFGFYAMNYHSRFPLLSLVATEESCARDSANFVAAALDCNAFNGSLRQQIGDLLGIDTLLPAGEPLPIDTLRIFLDYPEDIRLYGVSFNTNVGSWSLAGEYAYRPNLPVQVHISDVIFSGLQPAFPRQDIAFGLPGTPVSLGTLPGVRNAAPDFLSVYRGVEIGPRDIVRGYERQKVGQLGLTAIRTISSSNPLRADQIILLVEVGATHVVDMPDTDELQFEGGVYHRDTHASPGADGTGSGGVPDTRRFNPTQQTGAFADDFAWGYRLVSRFEYNEVFPGINLKPTLVYYHDVSGIAVFPMQNFVEGRKQYLVGSEIDFGGGWTGQLLYQGFAGRNSNLRDRDNIGVSLAYTF